VRKLLRTLIVILNLLATIVTAQVNEDTPNLSFEDGSLNGWKVYTGDFFYDIDATSPTFGSYTYNWSETTPALAGERIRLVPGTASSMDPVVACKLPTNPDSKNVIRIGRPNFCESWKGGKPYLKYSAAEKIEYSFVVTPNTTLLSYRLAAVLHVPTNDSHHGEQLPNYNMEILAIDSLGMPYLLPCSYYISKADENPNLLRNDPYASCQGSISKNGEEFVYQKWLYGHVDLSNQIGKTVIIRVSSHDCLLDAGTQTDVAGGHSAHGYFWAETKKLELQSFSCENADASIVAPQGFSSYTWSRSDGKPVTVLNPLQPYIATIEKSQNVEGIEYFCSMDDVNSNCGALTISTSITPVKLYPDFTNVAVDAGKIQFTDASTADGDSITNYYWDFGDGSYSALKNPVHEYFDFIPFNVKLTVTSSKGCSKTISHNVLPTKELIADIFPPANLQYNGQTKDFSDTTNIAGFQKNIDYYIRYTNLPGTPFYNSYSAPANVGDYNATFELSYVNLLKYYMNVVPSKNFTVTKAPLTITVSDVEKTYGEPILLQREAFTQSLKPLYAGDKIYELNLTCGGLADTASVRSYPIVADKAIGLGVDNYDIQFVDGTLKVNAKPIVLKAIDAQKVYGDLITPNGTEFFVAPNSLVGTDNISSVDLVCAGFAETAIIGDHPITPQNAVGTRLNNYSFSYVPANLQVAKKSLLITANALTKTYGDAYVFTGNEYTQNPSSLVGTDQITSVQFSSAATPFNATTGDHPITINGITGTGLANYDVKYSNSSFKVLPLAIEIRPTNLEKEYSSNLNFNGNEFSTDKPLVKGDSITFVLLKSIGSVVSAPIGKYDITASSAYGVGTLNYAFSYPLGELNVVRKKITASINPPASLVYNGQEKECTATLSIPGFVLFSDYIIRYTSADNSYNSTTPPTNAGTYTATFELLTSAAHNYLLQNPPTYTFTISKASVTITANDASKTYGDNLVLLNDAYKSDLKPLYGSDKIASVSFVCNALMDTASVGTYNIEPSAVTGSGMENYNFSFVNGKLTVEPKTLRIQGLDLTKTYGDQYMPTGKEFYVDPNQFVGMDTVTTVALTSGGFASIAKAGSHTITVNHATGMGLSNYHLIYTNSLLYITKKNITVTANAISKTYGSVYNFTGNEFTADKTAFVGTDSIESVTLSSEATQLKAQVGDHILTLHSVSGLGLENYQIKLINSIFKVNPLTVTITANNIQKEYGSLVTFDGNEFTLDKPLVVGDTILYVIFKSAGSPALASVGEYNIIPSMAYGAGSMNYDFQYLPGKMTVLKKLLKAKLIAPSYLVYNAQTKDFRAELNITGLEQNSDYYIRYANNADPAKSSYTPPTKVGTYKATFELNYSTTFNYSIDSIPWQNFEITKAPLTIRANNATKTYGDNFNIMSDAYTADMKPLFGSDLIFSALFDCQGMRDTVMVGNYPIMPTKVLGNGLENYAISYQAGTLAVQPKTITVRAIDAAKMYGDEMSSYATSFIIDSRAMVGADKIQSVTMASDGLAANAIVGKYPIKLTSATGIRLNNYSINYSDGLLQVYKKPLIVQADSLRKVYGNEYVFKGTEFLIDKTQLVANDKVNSVKLNSQAVQKRASVGEYILSVTDISGFGLDNYDIKLQSNIFTVTPRPLVVIANNQEKGYGDVFAFTGNEFIIDRPMVNNDTISFVFLQSKGSSETASIGQHEITASQALGNGSLNYSISYRNGTLTVKHKELIVTAESYEKEYGQKDPDMRFEVRDQRGVEYLPTLFSGKLQRIAGEKPQTYAIKKGTLAINPNYNYSFVEGSLTIKKALPYLDPAFSNDHSLTIVSDVIGTSNGDTPSGIVAASYKQAMVSATVVLNGEARNGLTNLPDSMVVATINYSGDDNYLPVERKVNIYAIRYHTNGGDLANPIKHFDGNESIKLETPTRQQKYKFEGWYETPDFAGEPVRRIALGTYRDVDLYAKWVTSYDDLSIVVLFNQVLAVANPQNREFIYHSTFKWSKDGVALTGNKQYLGFENYVPTGEYKVEIYYEGNTPIQLDLKHTATVPQSMVYPNPVKKRATVSVVTEHVRATDTQVQVFTATGIRVHTVTVEKQADMFQIKGFDLAGVYVLRVIKNDQVVEMHKIIVEND